MENSRSLGKTTHLPTRGRIETLLPTLGSQLRVRNSTQGLWVRTIHGRNKSAIDEEGNVKPLQKNREPLCLVSEHTRN